MARAEANWERQVRAALRGDQMGGVYGVPASGIAGNVPSSLGNNTHINEVLRAADEIQDEDPTIARIQVDQQFDLMSESLYLTVYIIDMYLSLRPVLRRELQLVGVSALLIACKYEEIWAPEVNDFIRIFDSAYTREQILKMEKAILNRLEWNLTVPTPYVFLVRFAKAASSFSDHKNDKEMENTIFFTELALLQYGLVQSRPSMIAAAAVYAARLTLKRTPLWTDTLRHHTGFTEAQLMCWCIKHCLSRTTCTSSCSLR